MDRAAERLDHDPAVGLLVVRRPHLPDLALEVELGAGERQRRAPLPGAGLRGELPDARPSRCRTPAAQRCSACATRRGRRLRTCSRSGPASRAPSPAGARETAGTVSTAGRRRAPPRGCRRTGRSRPPGGSGPSGTAAPGRRARPADRFPGAAPAAEATGGRAGRCTSASASRSRRAGSCAARERSSGDLHGPTGRMPQPRTGGRTPSRVQPWSVCGTSLTPPRVRPSGAHPRQEGRDRAATQHQPA